MRIDQDVELVIRYRLTRDVNQMHITYHFKNEQGAKIFSTSGGRTIPLEHKSGEYEQICKIPANTLNWGSFAVDLYVIENRKEGLLIEDDGVTFTLANKEMAIGVWMGREPGDVTPHFDYSEVKIG